ncbi:hypothetical protein [Peterkaempfera sp. SMS 1(5)a]|uniref:hypothetical protein n=1 Tax=Peterkaempfera podocarpi TaxID=3232308 RepID=UPI0036718434
MTTDPSLRSERRPGAPRRVVVVGGGMAGHRPAQQPAGMPGGGHQVTVLGEEAHPGYNRVLPAEVPAGRWAPEVVALPPVPHGPVVRRGVGVAHAWQGDEPLRAHPLHLITTHGTTHGTAHSTIHGGTA